MNEITYTMEKRDFTDFARFSLKVPRCIFIYLKRILLITLVITAIAGCLLIKQLNIQAILLFFGIFLFYFIFFSIFGFISAFFFNGNILYKHFKGVDLNYTLRITVEGIERKSSSINSMYNWVIVKDIYDTKKAFYVFVSDFQAVIIPKRAFESEAEAKSFYNLMLEYKQKA